MKSVIGACLAALAAASLAWASPGPDERLDDPALEARALTLYAQLRCVVCQSQSIRDSNAPLAEDMRGVVRERLLAGDTDAEVRDYLQTRYGDYVLMMPPLQSNTLGLFLVPALVFLGGAAGLTLFVLTQSRKARDEEDADDVARARALDEEEGLS